MSHQPPPVVMKTACAVHHVQKSNIFIPPHEEGLLTRSPGPRYAQCSALSHLHEKLLRTIIAIYRWRHLEGGLATSRKARKSKRFVSFCELESTPKTKHAAIARRLSFYMYLHKALSKCEAYTWPSGVTIYKIITIHFKKQLNVLLLPGKISKLLGWTTIFGLQNHSLI